VVHVVRRHVDGQTDAVVAELFDPSLHPPIQAEG